MTVGKSIRWSAELPLGHLEASLAPPTKKCSSWIHR
jgi:hypothetical protein